MAKTSEINPNNILRTNQVIREAVDYVFFDRTPEERALMMMEVRTKNLSDIEQLSSLLDEEIGETFMRQTFADLLFKSKFGMDAEENIKPN